MPKFPPIPRLSIIVPVGNEVSAFEETLVSVLENRPQHCEVIVPHNGQYDDPFDLGDEVRLVVAEGGNLVDMVMAGARSARGHFVHVLADGLNATPGWTESALAHFQRNDTAAIAPVVRHRSDRRIISAGWCESASSPFQARDAGSTDAAASATDAVGAYLRTSFWRRGVLLSLGDAFLYDGSPSTESVTEVSYVFQQLLRRAGWRVELADDCDVLSNRREMIGEQATVERGRRLGAAKRFFSGGNRSIPLSALLKAAIGCITRSGESGQWFGHATSSGRVAQLEKRLRPEMTLSCESAKTVPMNHFEQSAPARRAA